MACGFQSGASNHHSPVTTSILPSLLTSAMATPSERNLVSTTVRFQVMLSVGFSSSAVAGTRAMAASKGKKNTMQNRKRMGTSVAEGGNTAAPCEDRRGVSVDYAQRS